MHKCDSCKFKGEHQEMGFKPSGVCTKEHNLLKAMLAYRAPECPFAENVEMKPCPFCGGEAKLSGAYTIRGVTAWAVYCGKTPSDFFCGAQITSIESEEKAIEAWNRRATDECDTGNG